MQKDDWFGLSIFSACFQVLFNLFFIGELFPNPKVQIPFLQSKNSQFMKKLIFLIKCEMRRVITKH